MRCWTATAWSGAPVKGAATPNALWCADFKGEFKLGNGQYCYPLTVTDQASRFLLLCEALESTKEKGVFEACRQLFRERGLPCASPNGLYNLSKLSVWWLRLGIDIERIQPGRPQQNGRHERMHHDLGYIDLEQKTLQTIDNPFGARLSPMS